MTPQERIDAYLTAPSLEAWKTFYSLMIPGTFRTMWQAWAAIDGDAPTSGTFTTFPDAFTMRRGIKAAREGKIPVGLECVEAANRQAPRAPK